MENQPLVSVIVPVYNVEKYLKQCLDSIVNQTLKNIEIICVDDGSTDESLNILKEYAEKDNRIKILTQQNLYAGVARNNGLKIAKGKYLSFLDSDDFFKLNMLENMYNRAEKDNSDVVICGWYNYNNDTKQITIHLPKTKESLFNPEKIKNSLFLLSHPNPWTKLFKKSLFLENNLYFEKLIRCNDLTCVYTALAIANKISIIKEPYVYYRSNQRTNLSANRSKNFDCFIYAINRLYENLIERNKYLTYKRTFVERLLNSLKKEVSFCKDKKAVYIQIKQLINENLYEDLSKDINKMFNITEHKVKHQKLYRRTKNKYF